MLTGLLIGAKGKKISVIYEAHFTRYFSNSVFQFKNDDSH